MEAAQQATLRFFTNRPPQAGTFFYKPSAEGRLLTAPQAPISIRAAQAALLFVLVTTGGDICCRQRLLLLPATLFYPKRLCSIASDLFYHILLLDVLWLRAPCYFQNGEITWGTRRSFLWFYPMLFSIWQNNMGRQACLFVDLPHVIFKKWKKHGARWLLLPHVFLKFRI